MSDTSGVVGRDRELATMTAFLDALPSGPSGLLLEGAAGIGKTTVWEAGVAGAAARSYIILSSRPAESEATLSFAALGDLMDGLLGQVLPQLPPPQRRALEVALLIEDPVGSPPEQRAVCLAFLAGDPPPVRFRAGGYRDRRPAMARPSERGGAGVRTAAARERAGRAAGFGPDSGRRAGHACGRSRPAGRAPRAHPSRTIDPGRFRGGPSGIGRRLAFPA